MTRILPEETLGQRIARLRARNGWTQQQLADRIAASRVAISHFEMGLALPSERTVILLAGLFKIEPPELIAETQYPEAKAERLPAVALRYSEAELHLAMMRRDLEWAARLGATTVAQTAAQWHATLSALHANTSDPAEQKLLTGALDQLETR